jgi:acetylcholinesterase
MDEGASFGGSGINTTEEVAAAISASYPTLNSSISTLLELYPDNPSLGSPYNQGDTVLPGGLQQKRYNSFAGDVLMHAGRRRLSEVYAAAGAPVYSYNFNQTPQNATNAAGVRFLLMFLSLLFFF